MEKATKKAGTQKVPATPPLFGVSQMGEVARVSGSGGVLRRFAPSAAARQLPHADAQGSLLFIPMRC